MHAFLRWAGWLSLLAFVGALAVMLYLDRQYGVTSAFPLKQHPTPPFIAFLLLGTLGFPLGGSLLIGALADWARAALSRSWPTAAARVLKSEVVTTLGKGPRNIADVRYEYEVAGKRYAGSTIRFSQGKYRFRDQAERVIERYPPGAEVAVHYDPDNPATAALETSSGAALYTILWSVIFLLFPWLGYAQFFRDMLNG